MVLSKELFPGHKPTAVDAYPLRRVFWCGLRLIAFGWWWGAQPQPANQHTMKQQQAARQVRPIIAVLRGRLRSALDLAREVRSIRSDLDARPCAADG
jgi:hypothetical protein